MHLASLGPRGRRIARWSSISALLVLTLLFVGLAPPSPNADADTNDTIVAGSPIAPVATAIVNFADLARREGLAPGVEPPPIRPRPFREIPLEDPPEPAPPPGANSLLPVAPSPLPLGPLQALIASPPPSVSYMGLNDIPMVDSMYIVIPPDIGGAVGLTKVMCGFNNNYRIQDKATGATISTVGTATFWAPVTPANLLSGLTDPRTTYDPYNNVWIVVMQTTNLNGSILVGVSQTSDPSGAWYLYRFANLAATSYLIDFPILGFNRNWIATTINLYSSAGAFQRGICLALNYGQARTGTGTGTLFTQAAGTHFSTSPAVTYSATLDTLFLVTHLSSGGATYTVDRITGFPAAPVYTSGGTNVRPGGGWTQPGGNILPQSAPNAGASACTPPCPIESQDAQVRSSPVWRNGFLYYTQTIGLPAGGLTHTAVQWTKLKPSTAPLFVDGGRLDDPTATSTNGGKWYAYPAISVNAANDFMIGFSQFSSAQHPAAGYAMHLAGDGAGSLRDAFIYHAGEDYYHKTFTTATGRNRWGDFSTTQVDPCDDLTLWTLQEYGKTRTGTDDGNTGSNSSKWSSWWAAVAGPPRLAGLTCPPDTLADPSAAVTRMFRITNLGTAPDQFTYSVFDAAGWGGPVNGTTPVLAPSSFFDVFINLTLPADCIPSSDLVVLSVHPIVPQGCPTSSRACSTRVVCDQATATLLGRFDAEIAAAGVDLFWWSDAVGEIEAWNVDRAKSEAGPWLRLNSAPIAMGSGGAFRFHDDGAISGDVYYRLIAQMKGGGQQALSSMRVAAGGEAFSFAIASHNPFLGSTRLRYTLPRAVPVKVEVFSVAGERVRTLVNRVETPGVHTVDFALRGGGRTLSPGIYMVQITAGDDQKTLRLVGMQ
ncbi:MAG: hypothetical protein A2W00_08730 [Candidatus Eisenbacteria bacterium RBG_16_71_46]|nr:MAG: hypothetical protein A2W00_08730 [Candidatus Eisenbacteria bacterium RBG_16_71_46]